MSLAPKELDLEGSGAKELRIRFLSRPPLDWENCHARIDVGRVEDMVARDDEVLYFIKATFKISRLIEMDRKLQKRWSTRMHRSRTVQVNGVRLA